MEKLLYPNGEYISYNKIKSNSKNTVVCLHGFWSNKNGTKINRVKNFCADRNYNFVAFDYFGHGESSRDIRECDFSCWVDNCLKVVDELVEDKCVLVGSSLGGWLSLLTALARPNKVKALVLMAPAPDFTVSLMDRYSTARPELKEEFERTGCTNLKSSPEDVEKIITKKIIESSFNYLLLNRDKIEVNCPVRLLQGCKDMSVDYRQTVELVNRLESEDVELTLMKTADHRFKSEACLKLLEEKILDVIE